MAPSSFTKDESDREYLRDEINFMEEQLVSILKRLFTQPQISVASAVNLRSLIDTTKECVRSLEVLSIPVQHWDAALLYVLFSKVDNGSRELWEQSLPDTNIPSISKLYDFLEQRARALAASSTTTASRPPPSHHHKQPPTTRTHHTSPSSCKLGCTDQHFLFRCLNFRNKTMNQRLEFVKQHNLCRNCFSSGHSVAQCKSQNTCKICQRKHHTMLHLDTPSASATTATTQPPSNIPPTGHSLSCHTNHWNTLQTGILATAKVRISSSFGDITKRAFLDNGSTNSHITEKSARALGLHLQPCNVHMTGLQESTVAVAKYLTSFQFKPHFNSDFQFTVTALVVKKISGHIPSSPLDRSALNHIDGITLADPDFHTPATVDILLGTDVFWNILESGKIVGDVGQPVAVNSSLGWLVAGANNSTTAVRVHCTNAHLGSLLQRFWEEETLPEETTLTEEEAKCEQHFQTTHNRDSNGRFTVRLPFKTNPAELGVSRATATRRFHGLERKFQHQDKSKIWTEYKLFMKEYLDMGHMRENLSSSMDVNHPGYYIPHHCVIKESSTTTKLRVVFDASAVTSSKVSLNQCMLAGPQLQDSLLDIMLRFRMHNIVFTADVEKMYRQIRVHDDDVKFQKILWRDHPSQPLKEYELLTVTYGTTSAPYLAVKCLQQLAQDEKHRFPHGSRVALSDFYVDDTASGTDTLESAIATVRELIALCDAGGFPLRKWTTNSKELLATIPTHLHEPSTMVEFNQDRTIKTLGIFWNPQTDNYIYKLNLPITNQGPHTKRSILSAIAKIFDPLGLLAPVIISCKILMQGLWKIEADWDTVLDHATQNQWNTLQTSLQDISQLTIPRCVFPFRVVQKYLIGCSDASIKAISAVVYIYAQDNSGNESCRLLTSKTRVAPVKHVTLPRLELNGAVLLSELLSSTQKALHTTFDGVRAYVDSTIALHWINSDPSRWKPYVKRRTQAIKQNLPNCSWYHIPGERNPADCASRGISAAELVDHPLWWNGALDFFRSTSPPEPNIEDESLLESEMQIRVHHAQPQQLHNIFSRYSSFRKLQRVIAYVLRFIRNWSLKRQSKSLHLGPISVNEATFSRNLILRHLQAFFFSSEIRALEKGKELPTNSRILDLQPYLCQSDGLLHVGGRLRNAQIPHQQRHPIILPRKHAITESIVRDIHVKNFHAGPQAALAFVQQQFWIPSGKDAVRFILKKCVTCTRYKAVTMKQQMADLPFDRVNSSRPFSKTGVDYAGPFLIKPMVRSRVTLKCWIAIFVCMCTKAIHVELVSSLSTDCFIASLRRFTSRRGVPSDMHSDCGTNFVGADNVLRDFFILCSTGAVQDELARQSISWHFNPAGAPHFGGLWEAGVKSIKYHLVRVAGATRFTYEEFQTLIIQIEGILNSRPLTPSSSDPSDLSAITPGHFLIGGPLNAIPEPSLLDYKENHLKRWQILQQTQQRFWQRWSREYLSRLQQRPKWLKSTADLEIGSMVHVKDERLPPLHWKLGRIVAVHPGKDGHTRVATVRTKDGEIKRPIVKLSLLPIQSQNNSVE